MRLRARGHTKSLCHAFNMGSSIRNNCHILYIFPPFPPSEKKKMNRNTYIPHYHGGSGAADKYGGGIDGTIAISTSDVGRCGGTYTLGTQIRRTCASSPGIKGDGETLDSGDGPDKHSCAVTRWPCVRLI